MGCTARIRIGEFDPVRNRFLSLAPAVRDSPQGETIHVVLNWFADIEQRLKTRR
jgi:hypothetical protein